MDGLVQTHFSKRLDLAQAQYDSALLANPSDSLAWLLKGTLHAFKGEGALAVAGTQRALKLSPLDPHRWYYDSLAATAFLADRQYERALKSAQLSLRGNPAHTSTLRAIAIAELHLGRPDRARDAVRELLNLDPHLTVARWRELSPSAPFEIGREWAEALRQAGLPA